MASNPSPNATVTPAPGPAPDSAAIRPHGTPSGGTTSRLTSEFPRELGIVSVLLVDDDAPLRRAVGRNLRSRNYTVHEAGSLAEGRTQLILTRPDLLLVDLNLPDGNGVELVRASKAANPARPVLVLSGTQEQNERIEAFDAGADDVVGKPIVMQELRRRVEVHDRILRAATALQGALKQVDNERLFAAEAVALLAHDLNNGLTVAASNLSFLADMEGTGTDPEVLEAVTTTQRALRRMSILVKNFVDIARSEDGALKPARAKTNAGEILRMSAAIHHPRGFPADRGIEIDCPDVLEAWVDPILLERIIHNLLINATRYVNSKGRVVLSGDIMRSGGRDLLIIRIMNTGPPIPVALRANLFEKYKKGDDRKAQSGMGLYFCRLASEAHGGTVAVIDVPDFQTCFEVRLPSQPPLAG